MLDAALPDSSRLEESHFLAPARRAGHAIRPSNADHEVETSIRIGKVTDRVHEGLRCLRCAHTQNCSLSGWVSQVYYCPSEGPAKDSSPTRGSLRRPLKALEV